MKKLLMLSLCLVLLGAGSIFAAKKACGPKSKACGNTCIAMDKECHKETKPVKAKKCGAKSKACGNTCIAANKECKVEKEAQK